MHHRNSIANWNRFLQRKMKISLILLACFTFHFERRRLRHDLCSVNSDMRGRRRSRYESANVNTRSGHRSIITNYCREIELKVWRDVFSDFFCGRARTLRVEIYIRDGGKEGNDVRPCGPVRFVGRLVDARREWWQTVRWPRCGPR